MFCAWAQSTRASHTQPPKAAAHPAAAQAQYLGVFLVTAVDLCDALLGAFGGRRRRESLLHPDGSFPETALDAEGFIQLVHLRENKHADGTKTSKSFTIATSH